MELSTFFGNPGVSSGLLAKTFSSTQERIVKRGHYL